MTKRRITATLIIISVVIIIARVIVTLYKRNRRSTCMTVSIIENDNENKQLISGVQSTDNQWTEGGLARSPPG